MPTISYPLDTTGLSVSNKITDELHTLTEINDSTYRIIVPTFAPFYLDNFSITHTDSLGEVRTLVPDVDYVHCLSYISGTRSVGKTLYGGITINTMLINGVLKVTYQTLGGEWTADSNYVLERIAERVYNPRTTIWDIVTNKPNAFPPTDHAQALDTVFGQRELVEAINALATQLANQDPALLPIVQHIQRTNNPHNVTKLQVGLGNIVDLPLATDAEVQAHTALDKYVTLKQIVDYIVAAPIDWSSLDNHLADQANPHGVNKEQIGLGSVSDLAVASSDDITNKVAANKYVVLSQVLTLLTGVQTDIMADVNTAINNAVGGVAGSQQVLTAASYYTRRI